MYIIGGIVFICGLSLGVLSRRESVERDGNRLLLPFRKMALYIYKKLCIRSKQFFSSAQVERDLHCLYPEEGKERLAAKYYVNKLSISLAVLFLGTLFGMFVRYNSQKELLLDEEGAISRGNYREGSVKVGLKTDYGEGESGSFQIEVAPRRLTEEEALVLSEELWNRLPEYILGQNESPDRVFCDLVLEESYGDYPFLLEWTSRNPAVVGSTGRVYPVEEAVPVEMAVRMTYGELVREEKLMLTVMPAPLSAAEQEYAELENLLLQSEYESRGEEVWRLPGQWHGKTVSWQQETEDYSVVLWGVAVVAAVSVYAMSDQDLHRQQEQRKKRMQSDYPEIIHKLSLYISAGMTIRGAFQKIAGDCGQKRGKEDLHPAYTEMRYACRELHSGVSEASVYEHFGKRTGLQEYIRLSTLLAQNLKKGNGTLAERLREETGRVWEERLQSCKRLGEEAGTKLLVPMVLMLLVVMVMIMIPAFTAM